MLSTLRKLTDTQLKRFIWFLKNDDEVDGIQNIQECDLPDDSNGRTVVDNIVATYGKDSLMSVFIKVLKRLPRNDLVSDLIKEVPSQQEAAAVINQAPFQDGPCVSKTGRQSPEKPKDCYKMDSMPRGLCLIINNMFRGRTKHRVGSEKDAEAVAIVFSWLGFEVVMFTDLEAKSMEYILKVFSEIDSNLDLSKLKSYSPDLWVPKSNYTDGNFKKDDLKTLKHGDAFICFILSHGTETGIEGIDDCIMESHKIYTPFYKTTSLIGKPKVFFIQACRGGDRLGGHKDMKDNGGATAVSEDGSQDEETFIDYQVPNMADTLVVWANVHGHVSFRRQTGSWFIQNLCKQLKEFCHRGEEIHEILIKVKFNVGQRRSCPDSALQMPESTNDTLMKRLVFKPVN